MHFFWSNNHNSNEYFKSAYNCEFLKKYRLAYERQALANETAKIGDEYLQHHINLVFLNKLYERYQNGLFLESTEIKAALALVKGKKPETIPVFYQEIISKLNDELQKTVLSSKELPKAQTRNAQVYTPPRREFSSATFPEKKLRSDLAQITDFLTQLNQTVKPSQHIASVLEGMELSGYEDNLMTRMMNELCRLSELTFEYRSRNSNVFDNIKAQALCQAEFIKFYENSLWPESKAYILKHMQNATDLDQLKNLSDNLLILYLHRKYSFDELDKKAQSQENLVCQALIEAISYKPSLNPMARL